MPIGSADATYRQVIEVEGTQAIREIEAFKAQLGSVDASTAELQRQFAAVSAAADRMAAQIAEAKRKAEDAARTKGGNDEAAKAAAAAEVLAAQERAVFEANLEVMRASGEKYEAARVKARADAQAQIEKIEQDARLSAEQRAEAIASQRRALEQEITAITLQETQAREKLEQREAAQRAKAAKQGGEEATQNLTRFRGILSATGVTTSQSLGMAADVTQNLVETLVQVGPAAAVAAGAFFGLAQAVEYYQTQARRVAAEEFLGVDLATADAVAAAFGNLGAEASLALAKVSKQAGLTRGEMEALAVEAQHAARISGRSIAEEMENGLKRLGLTVSGVTKRYAEFVASLEEGTAGQKLISDAELKEAQEGLARTQANAAELREEADLLRRAFERALGQANNTADGLARQLQRRLEDIKGLDASIASQQAGLAAALVSRHNADVETLAKQGLTEIERLQAGALSDRERIEAEYAGVLKRYAGLAFSDAERFNQIQVAAARVRSKQLREIADTEAQDRIAALQTVAAAEKAAREEYAALARADLQFARAMLGDDASALEQHLADMAIVREDASIQRVAAEAEANERIAAIRADEKLTEAQRSAAVSAERKALSHRVGRIDVEEKAGRLAAETTYYERVREIAAPYFDWAAAEEAALTHEVDAQAAAQIVSLQKLADERIASAKRAAAEGRITSLMAADAEKQIARETADEIVRIRKEGAARAESEQLAALREATKGLDRNAFDGMLLDLGMTEKAVEQLRLSFVQMGLEGQAAWGGLGAAAEMGAMAVQAATAMMRQSISDWIMDNQYAQQIATLDAQDRMLQQDEAYQELIRQLAIETDAKRRSALEAKKGAAEERAYAQAKKQAAAESEIAQQKQLAGVLSALAAEAAVRAVFETGMGLASLWLNPAKAASHFAAAGVFAAVGGATAAVGSAISSSASRDELALANQERERERRAQELESDRAGRRGSALSSGPGGGTNITVTFVGSAFVTEAEMGAQLERFQKAWEGQR